MGRRAKDPPRGLNEQLQREGQRQQQIDAREREVAAAKEAFLATPAGRARLAFERGDQLLQYSAPAMTQKAIIVPMVGSNTTSRTADSTAILNSVCNEGWELVNGSFVFVETGQQSRDKFLSSGQNVAVSGTVMGYYIFHRSESSKRETAAEPWLAPDPGPSD